jgi:hypothetical protein
MTDSPLPCALSVLQATNPAASGGKAIRLRVRSYGSPLEEATGPKAPTSHADMVSQVTSINDRCLRPGACQASGKMPSCSAFFQPQLAALNHSRECHVPAVICKPALSCAHCAGHKVRCAVC